MSRSAVSGDVFSSFAHLELVSFQYSPHNMRRNQGIISAKADAAA
jgi:hypothetical protein